ncbi:BTAD domain-containing putative transcriptional regulator [Promicromonospora sp. NPDC019610]|uniref:AfsR/SARP family transcriptional regulator n=1 Tax=Promicromonospora sp. NPDC019610 TaxID=3364405 RepID=UPI0037892842
MPHVTGLLSVRLLGPFGVTVDGAPVALSSRLRTLLAVLALDVGRPVPTERIAAAVWGQDRPADPRKAIQVLVTRLRTALGADAVRTTPGGYQLDVPADAVDLSRFESALTASRAAADPAEEYRLLREALADWRGSPFETVDSDLLRTVDRPRLVQPALAAVERCADLALAGHDPAPEDPAPEDPAPDVPAPGKTAPGDPDLGVPDLGDRALGDRALGDRALGDRALGDRALGDLAATLRELVATYPLRESLWVRLMAVLDRTGRRADALAAYQDLYRILRAELGTSPGEEAQAAHRRLLAPEPAEPPGPPTPRAQPAPPAPPAMLPPPERTFRGRAAALTALDALLDTAPRIAVVDGPGGVGKTATVLHWAHRASDHFPDGTLYVNLRGYFPTNTPLAPAVAVRQFLDALGVPPARIPDDADAQAALYRSVLADRRVLVVLDNARDVEQVRPLLPGGRRCVVVVTSRNRLGGLVAVEGAARLALETLPSAEAEDVLAARLGAARLAAEPEAVRELLTLCGGLPLAHVIVAERAAARAGAPLAGLVRELHRSRISALSAGRDHAARSVFSWSYRALGADAAAVFRLLGLHPGPHVTVPSVASLGALPRDRARAAVAELERASLLIELAPGRFTMHELLMDYATELAAQDPPEQSAAATVRMLDHYLGVAHQAEQALAPPSEDRHTLGPPSDGVLATPPPSGYDAGLALLESEAPVLVAMVRRAAATGNDEHTWRIARCLRPYLWGRRQVPTLLEAERLALAGLERLGRVPEQVGSRRWIAHALMRLGRPDDAWRALEPTLPLTEDPAEYKTEHKTGHKTEHHTGRHPEVDDTTRAWLLNTTAAVLSELGRPDEALDHAERSLDLFRRTGDLLGDGCTESAVGLYLRRLGKLDDALAAARHAYATLTEAGDVWVRCYTRELVGDVQLDLGEPDAAAATYRACAEDLRALGRTDELAGILAKLAAARGTADAGAAADADTARAAADPAGTPADPAGTPADLALADPADTDLAVADPADPPADPAGGR